MANTPTLYKHHVHKALYVAVGTMKEDEEKRNGEGWCSTERRVLEDALEALNKGQHLRVIMS